MKQIPLKQIGRWIGVSTESEGAVSGFAVDSRLAKSGEIFFALPGARTDGHQFLADVASKQVKAAVVSTSYQGSDYGLTLIRTENPLKALQKCAKGRLETFKGRIVGITGSVGKTTTKGFITTLLKEKFKVAASPGNNNSQIGIPLTILNHIEGDEEIIVLEMGMTLPGHISDLVDIAPPDVAVITEVALAHAGNFESLAAIGRAKGEIFSHPKTQIGILHYGIENRDELMMLGSSAKVTFSVVDKRADYFLTEREDQLEVVLKNGNKASLGPLNVAGWHNRHNALAAIACACSLGLDWDEVRRGIAKCTLPNQRLEHCELKNFPGIIFINDSYNASEISVKSALRNMPKPHEGGRRIAVLGDMPELGQFSAKCHLEVAKVALTTVDELLCYGEEARRMNAHWNEAGRPSQWFQSHQELIDYLKKRLKSGDVVLIKGARRLQMEKVLEGLA